MENSRADIESAPTDMPRRCAVALLSGYTLEGLQSAIQAAIGQYFTALAFADSVVRVARVEAAILSVSGIADISGTTLNGFAGNVILSAEWNLFEVPALGTVSLTEVV